METIYVTISCEECVLPGQGSAGSSALRPPRDRWHPGSRGLSPGRRPRKYVLEAGLVGKRYCEKSATGVCTRLDSSASPDPLLRCARDYWKYGNHLQDLTGTGARFNSCNPRVILKTRDLGERDRRRGGRVLRRVVRSPWLAERFGMPWGSNGDSLCLASSCFPDPLTRCARNYRKYGNHPESTTASGARFVLWNPLEILKTRNTGVRDMTRGGGAPRRDGSACTGVSTAPRITGNTRNGSTAARCAWFCSDGTLEQHVPAPQPLARSQIAVRYRTHSALVRKKDDDAGRRMRVNDRNAHHPEGGERPPDGPKIRWREAFQVHTRSSIPGEPSSSLPAPPRCGHKHFTTTRLEIPESSRTSSEPVFPGDLCRDTSGE